MDPMLTSTFRGKFYPECMVSVVSHLRWYWQSTGAYTDAAKLVWPYATPKAGVEALHGNNRGQEVWNGRTKMKKKDKCEEPPRKNSKDLGLSTFGRFNTNAST